MTCIPTRECLPYTMEYQNLPEVLDLSTSHRSSTESIQNHDQYHPNGIVRSPIHQNVEEVGHLPQYVTPEIAMTSYPNIKYAPVSPERHIAEDNHISYPRENGHSPTFYVTEAKDTSNSPPEGSRHGSPTYGPYIGGTEHLNQYVLHAAFQQQLMLQQNQQSANPRVVESDAVSETGSEGSHNSAMPMYPIMSTSRDGKMTRPFKAYPKDPLSLTAGFSSVDSILDTQSAEKFSAFRKKMLEQICAANGGQATVSNPKMRRTINTNNNNYANDDGKVKYDSSSKDNLYTERRKKNNAAAKKSRDRRRIKEDEIAIRAAFLERENIELKFELAAARKQLANCGISTIQS